MLRIGLAVATVIWLGAKVEPHAVRGTPPPSLQRTHAAHHITTHHASDACASQGVRTIDEHSPVVGGDEGVVVERTEREGAHARRRRDALGVLDPVAVNQREVLEPAHNNDATLAADDIFTCAWGAERAERLGTGSREAANACVRLPQ